MGLRCLIGHEYGDPQTSRDRRQRGSEVVVTVQEYRECTRCGHRRIISENKEVTSEPTTERDSGSAAEASWSPPTTDVEPDDDPVGSDVGAVDEPLSADEDDGIILEDDPVEPPRSYGQWPKADLGDGDGPDADHDPWPEEDEPVAAGELAGSKGHQPADTDESATAASPATDDAGAGPETAGAGEASVEPSTPTPPPNPSDAELVCPGCGETWASVNASLRPGDICPECHDGYLEERVIQ